MDLSPDTLGALLVGGLAALPMVALRYWTWTPGAAKAWPALEDMHAKQREVRSWKEMQLIQQTKGMRRGR